MHKNEFSQYDGHVSTMTNMESLDNLKCSYNSDMLSMTNSSKNLIVFKIIDNVLVNKMSMNTTSLLECNSIDDFLSLLKSRGNELRYFDEEEEMISVVENSDFAMFKQIVSSKKFMNNEVFVLCYNSKLTRTKYNTVDKIRNMKVETDSIQLESASIHYKKCKRKAGKNYESSISSSSSEIKRKSKKVSPMSGRFYSAVVKKELNYLPGSEISDGQTICKKWKIKNTGTKKWKENTIQCILLPTEFSDWVDFEQINIPPCYVDQKVSAEMVIRVNGKWSNEQLSSECCCQNIKLKWLLISNKLMSESSLKLHDYILTCIELNINVRYRLADTISCLTKHASESSIEKIDQEFSFVNVSESEDELPKKPSGNFKMNSVQHQGTSECLSEIELPECPNADDFQITDFNQPGTSLTVSIVDSNKHQCNDTDKLILSSVIDKPQSTDEMMKLERIGSNVANIVNVPSKDFSDDLIFVESNESEENLRNGMLTQITTRHDLVSCNEGTVETQKESNKSLYAEDYRDFQNSVNMLDLTTTSEFFVENANGKHSNIESKTLESTAHNLNIKHTSEELCPMKNKGKENSNLDIYSTPLGSLDSNSSDAMNIQKPDAQQNLMQNNLLFPNNSTHPGRIERIPHCIDSMTIQNFTDNLQMSRQDSDRINNGLKNGGKLYPNINSDFKCQYTENNQLDKKIENLLKLREFGFSDEDKNYRLLTKFDNNLDDVLNELFDD